MKPIVVPWWWIAMGFCTVAGLLVAVGGFWRVARRREHFRESVTATGADQGAGLPELDVPRAPSGLFHRWDPRFKVASLVFFAFVAVSLNHWGPLFLCLALAAGSVAAARTPLRFAAQRLLAMSGFLLMLLLIMPLTVPFHAGDRRIVIEGLTVLSMNLRGLELAARICLKAVVVALTMEPLLRTAPFSVTMAALHRLGVPLILCQMLLLMYRYAFVFRHEMQRMWVGMSVRGFRSRTAWDTFGALGSFLGMLFVRSMERTQRVYEAMLCRGYTGVFPTTVRFRSTRADRIWAAVWVSGSGAVLAADRWNALLGALPFFPR